MWSCVSSFISISYQVFPECCYLCVWKKWDRPLQHWHHDDVWHGLCVSHVCIGSKGCSQSMQHRVSAATLHTQFVHTRFLTGVTCQNNHGCANQQLVRSWQHAGSHLQISCMHCMQLLATVSWSSFVTLCCTHLCAAYINPASAELSLCMLSSPGWVFPHTAPKTLGMVGKNSF